MKSNRGFGLYDFVALVVIVTVLAVAQARAGWPTTKALTLPGGGTNVVSADYDVGIGNDVYSSFSLQALEVVFDSAVTSATTVTVRRASSGPAYFTATCTSGTTSFVSFETNAWSFNRGDDIHVTCTATNSGTATALGEEQ